MVSSKNIFFALLVAFLSLIAMVSSLPVEVEDLNTAAALPGTNNVPAVPGLDLTAALPGTDGIPALPGVVVVSDIPEAVNGTISGSVDNVNEQGPYPIRCNGLHLFQNYIDQCRDMMSRQGNTLFIAKKGGIKLCPGPGNDASGSVHVTGRAWEDDKGKEARATGSEIAGAIQAIQAKCNHLGGSTSARWNSGNGEDFIVHVSDRYV